MKIHVGMIGYVQFAWMREDGTITWDRDEIIGNVRKVAKAFKNSDHFVKLIDQDCEKLFKLSKPKISS